VILVVTVVIESAQQQIVLAEVVSILKPVVCQQCDKRFPDVATLQTHETSHKVRSEMSSSSSLNCYPKTMSVDVIKRELRDRGLSTTGKKDVLILRLEGALSTERE
jgi:hypothetical protein